MSDFINSYKCLDCKHCFQKSIVFQHLSEDELGYLNDRRTEVNFKAGEIIYKQGTPLTHIVIINSGYGKIYLEGYKGRNQILTFTKQYELNAGVGLFIDLRHHSSLMAVTDVSACFVDVVAFKEVLKKNSKFMDEYLKAYSKRVLHTYQQLSILTQKNMEGRMAESILHLHNDIFKNGAIKNVSKQDLAELTAMTRESALRVLKDFRNDGLIEMVDHSIIILDENALKNIALHG